MRPMSRRHSLPLAAALLAVVAASGAASAKEGGAWQLAQPVTAVNSISNEGCPIESPDGKRLFIMSERAGTQDIWVASRADVGEAFGEPVRLPEPVNSATANDYCPTPLRGGGLLFVSNRGGTDAYGTAACGGGDLYLTRLSPATGEWRAPQNLGCVANGGPNSPGQEFGPSLVSTAAGTQLFFSAGASGMGSNTQDIYVSLRAEDGSFGMPTLVTELQTGSDDAMPNVRKDGLEMVFTSNRLGTLGNFDIWSSSRASVFEPWGPAQNLGTSVNTAAGETRPSLSWKAERLYFGRAGEIFVSSR